MPHLNQTSAELGDDGGPSLTVAREQPIYIDRLPRTALMQLHDSQSRYLLHLDRTQALSPHSMRAYTADLESLTSHLGQTSSVEDVNPQGLLSYFDAQRHAGKAPATLRRRASTIRGFCSWLRDSRLVAENPWTHLELKIRPPKRLPRPARPSAVRMLLDHLAEAAELSRHDPAVGPLARPHQAVTLLAVSIMVTSGLRVSEAVSLETRNLELDRRRLRVLGKGSRERQVFLTNDWITALSTAQLVTREHLDVRHDQLLFNQRRQPLSAAALRSRVTAAAAQAGISERVTPHMLRHSAATQLIECGVDIRFVQRLLGHASLATTELYTHVADDSLRRAVTDADVLGRTLRPRTP